ncbi:pyridoxamine kinase [Faecalibacillus faecis]|uniref:pyridoxamine kinase n=1 Tax=Faecalibacillus faecis TaxID=1982628 RepID=UPI0038680DA5
MDKGDITNQTKHKKICCVNDMPGVGKIALSAMIPFLSVNGIDVTSLPTALVSNTLDFGKFNILDTTEYMDKTIDIWKSLGFKFDCISIGFMVNPKQIDIIERLINNHDKEKLVVVVDPIMGDEGKLYNGMTEFNVQIMRKLTAYADILIPNFTEACYLVDGICSKKNLTSTEAKDLVKQLRILGAKSVVITSSFVNNKNCVIGYDHLNDYFFIIEFDLVDVRFPGTGDIFSSILISDVLNGNCLYEATKHAMEVTRDIILYNKNKDEKFFGVDIEKYISEGKL